MAAGDARKADGSGQAVRNVWNPAMIAIATGDDGGNGSGNHGVAGIKATRVQGIVHPIEKTVSKGTVACVLQGLLSAGDALESQVQHIAVGNASAMRSAVF